VNQLNVEVTLRGRTYTYTENRNTDVINAASSLTNHGLPP